jgi:tRNA threonylcarbamoyladenosine biosynthesis protein TsaE
MIDYGRSLSLKHSKILLYGDLWAWKTHFVKWFVSWLWIDIKKVQSPTYAYVNIYDNKILHIDMYRIVNFEQLLEKWILELIDNHEYILIEWPKFEQEYTDNKWKIIHIEKLDELTRKIF